jgi:hypothetical protein
MSYKQVNEVINWTVLLATIWFIIAIIFTWLHYRERTREYEKFMGGVYKRIDIAEKLNKYCKLMATGRSCLESELVHKYDAFCKEWEVYEIGRYNEKFLHVSERGDWFFSDQDRPMEFIETKCYNE